MNAAVIFGGAGFLGTSFAKKLIDEKIVNSVYICDIETIKQKKSSYRESIKNEFIHEIYVDVREKIDLQIDAEIKFIANFAAIHREPGHEEKEYFHTNLVGAENVCNWADQVNCRLLIFSSSISIYGSSNNPKTEDTLPTPTSPYGISKIISENIHRFWHLNDTSRRLIIIRPGVIYGAGEGGNLSRLVRSLKRRYFFYFNNKKIIKAGIYIEELCNMMCWSIKKIENIDDNLLLFNAVSESPTYLEDYVSHINKIHRISAEPINLPFSLVLISSMIINSFSKVIPFNHPFDPVRVRKLINSNNIVPKRLIELGYKYEFTLREALSDWRKKNIEDWR